MCLPGPSHLVWLNLQAKRTFPVKIPCFQFFLLCEFISRIYQNYLLNIVGWSCQLLICLIGICFKIFIMKKAYLVIAVRHQVPQDRFHITFLSSEGTDICIMDSFKQSLSFWFHVGKMIRLLKGLDCALSLGGAHSLPAAGAKCRDPTSGPLVQKWGKVQDR